MSPNKIYKFNILFSLILDLYLRSLEKAILTKKKKKISNNKHIIQVILIIKLLLLTIKIEHKWGKTLKFIQICKKKQGTRV